MLSLVAAGGAIFFCMLIYQRLTASKRDRINRWAALVLSCLAWWNLCDAFFYVAPSKEAAWFFLQLGAPGWCGFIAVTAYYFLVMTDADKKLKPAVKIFFALPPLLLVLRFMSARPTPMADDLVQSGSGLGWTYVQSYRSIWPFLFWAYLIAYMGGALFYLYLWQRKAKSRSSRRLAKGFVLLDSVAVGLGFLSIFVLPYFTAYLPPMGCLATLVFGFFYWGWLRDYDFLHLELALNPGYILESCIDAMVVTDDEFHILYGNAEAQKLLGADGQEGADYLDCLTDESRDQLAAFLASGRGKGAPLELALKSGVPFLCSISRIPSRKRGLDVCILCMNEISQLKEAQKRLHYLAHYDDLTGLYNRRSLGKALDEWCRAAQSGGEDFELLFLDLTGFKQINDRFGHAAGDEALAATARALRACVGAEDVLARFAGDEFVVLNRAGGERDMEARLRRAVQGIDSAAFAPGVRMDVDVGRGLYSETNDADALLRLADSRMYFRKRAQKP